MRLSRRAIRSAYEAACRAEIEALKPGNVHVFADGHRMSAAQFLVSAEVSSAPLTRPGSPLGARLLAAVSATRQSVGTNTNLGILLLAGPLAMAAEQPGNLRANLRSVLAGLTIEDAALAFRAIALAAPGGLGQAARHDVHRPPETTLLEAMREAAPRDRIARQYVTDYADVFDVALPVLNNARAAGETGMWPTIFVYMELLAALPDSHVARRHGLETAIELRGEAVLAAARLAAESDEAARHSGLAAFDADLKARGLNPGTTADLTVACLLVHNLAGELA